MLTCGKFSCATHKENHMYHCGCNENLKHAPSTCQSCSKKCKQYCNSCQVTFCQKCAKGKHTQCKVETLKEYAQRGNAQLQMVQKRMMESLPLQQVEQESNKDKSVASTTNDKDTQHCATLLQLEQEVLYCLHV